jgi:hypothetical protein
MDRLTLALILCGILIAVPLILVGAFVYGNRDRTNPPGRARPQPGDDGFGEDENSVPQKLRKRGGER